MKVIVLKFQQFVSEKSSCEILFVNAVMKKPSEKYIEFNSQILINLDRNFKKNSI